MAQPLTTLNEKLVASEIIRQVLLLRYSLHVRDKVIQALNDTERPVASTVRDMLRSGAGLRNAEQVRELERLIDQVNALRRPAWQEATRIAEEEMLALAAAEVEDQRDQFESLLPGVALLVPLAAGATALAKSFNGRTLRLWINDAMVAEGKRIHLHLYAAVAAGEDPASAARRIVGRAALRGRDGATQLSRSHLDTIVRSASVHFASHARDHFYQVNSGARYTPYLLPGRPVLPLRLLGGADDPAVSEARRQVAAALAAADAARGAGQGGVRLFVQEQFVAVLDSRTSQLCRGLDGRRYAVGEGPIPPLHPRCRSNRVLVLPNELGGPAYDPGTYASWIKSQPPEVREALTGSRRPRSGRARELAEELFTDYGSQPMSLTEIREEWRRLMSAY